MAWTQESQPGASRAWAEGVGKATGRLGVGACQVQWRPQEGPGQRYKLDLLGGAMAGTKPGAPWTRVAMEKGEEGVQVPADCSAPYATSALGESWELGVGTALCPEFGHQGETLLHVRVWGPRQQSGH